ncbi:hypothetical protein AB0K00_22595 [Dactylosporangium sp. NPDC049525]|uniref:hypothetical protein n=1 Tax=Dactylosporangium sp. NPDC049525 TaxID=3154730 RepID=UPI003416DD6B
MLDGLRCIERWQDRGKLELRDHRGLTPHSLRQPAEHPHNAQVQHPHQHACHPASLPRNSSSRRGASSIGTVQDLEKETLGLDLVRRYLGATRTTWSICAQHGVDADAIDDLRQFYEIKVPAGAEPDHVTLEDTQIRRALSTDKFFLVHPRPRVARRACDGDVQVRRGRNITNGT